MLVERQALRQHRRLGVKGAQREVVKGDVRLDGLEDDRELGGGNLGVRVGGFAEAADAAPDVEFIAQLQRNGVARLRPADAARRFGSTVTLDGRIHAQRRPEAGAGDIAQGAGLPYPRESRPDGIVRLERIGLEGVEIGVLEDRPPVGAQRRRALVRAGELAEGRRDRHLGADVVRADRAGGERARDREPEQAAGGGGGWLHGGHGRKVQETAGGKAVAARRRKAQWRRRSK